IESPFASSLTTKLLLLADDKQDGVNLEVLE
ncbi:hypothetical protein JCM5350_007883, partial [Sporobolomyces pararoseus]